MITEDELMRLETDFDQRVALLATELRSARNALKHRFHASAYIDCEDRLKKSEEVFNTKMRIAEERNKAWAEAYFFYRLKFDKFVVGDCFSCSNYHFIELIDGVLFYNESCDCVGEKKTEYDIRNIIDTYYFSLLNDHNWRENSFIKKSFFS